LDQRAGGGKTHGVFLLNSNAMDVVVDAVGVEYRATGGIIDLYLFTGDSPALVTAQYQALVGKPYLVPYWSLGYHQCRWGYGQLSNLTEVIGKFEENKLPIDTFWTDIDYMDRWKLFTVDPVNFPQKEFNATVVQARCARCYSCGCCCAAQLFRNFSTFSLPFSCPPPHLLCTFRRGSPSF